MLHSRSADRPSAPLKKRADETLAIITRILGILKSRIPGLRLYRRNFQLELLSRVVIRKFHAAQRNGLFRVLVLNGEPELIAF
jgi:hypothetical protein